MCPVCVLGEDCRLKKMLCHFSPYLADKPDAQVHGSVSSEQIKRISGLFGLAGQAVLLGPRIWCQFLLIFLQVLLS